MPGIGNKGQGDLKRMGVDHSELDTSRRENQEKVVKKTGVVDKKDVQDRPIKKDDSILGGLKEKLDKLTRERQNITKKEGESDVDFKARIEKLEIDKRFFESRIQEEIARALERKILSDFRSQVVTFLNRKVAPKKVQEARQAIEEMIKKHPYLFPYPAVNLRTAAGVVEFKLRIAQEKIDQYLKVATQLASIEKELSSSFGIEKAEISQAIIGIAELKKKGGLHLRGDLETEES